MTKAGRKIKCGPGPLRLRIPAGSLTFLLSVVIGFVVVSQLFASPLSDATPDNAIAKFTVAPNLKIDGQDILSPTGRIGVPNIDLSTCAAQCDNNQSCVAFSFDRWRQVCYLKNKVVAPLLDPASLTAVKNGTIPNKSNAPFKITLLPDRQFLGQPNRHTRVSNFVACWAACKDDENCVAFSFLKDVRTTDNCQIFENPEQGYVVDPSIVSGYKYQIPNMAALPPLAQQQRAPPPPLVPPTPPTAPKEASPPLATQAGREEAAGRQAEARATPPKEVPPALAPATPVTPPKVGQGLSERNQVGATPPVAPQAAPKGTPPVTAGSDTNIALAPPTAPTAALPQFPWPPPAASGSYVLPDNLLQDRRTVGEAVAAIISALEFNGYVERSFFQTETGGVALVTRLERINDDGSSVVGPQRWTTIVGHGGSTADLINFLRGLFFVAPGHYRVIVFILQDLPFSQSSRTINQREATTWLMSGFNILPSSIAERPFAPGGHCTVLVYEFASDGRTVDVITSGLTGKQHLEKAGVLSRLGNVN